MSETVTDDNIPLVTRSQGVTASERYLDALCKRTFLSLWSYPAVFRDQGVNQSGEGKEVCDLLVVFENHVIIFSDKYCAFPNSGDLIIDWNRWFRRAVHKSAKQAWGAERWIKRHPERLFLDRACNQSFPLELPSMDNVRFHLIVVAHDSSYRSKNVLGGSGSLMINSTITGESHYANEEGDGTPFTIGDIDPEETFAHVLDDVTLDILLNTVDTISDFINYLTKKESLMRSKTAVLAAGEEDLLAFYLKNLNDEKQHDFVFPSEYNAILIEEGHWIEFSESPERLAQLEVDGISYVWDTLIEEFSSHILTGTQYFTSHPGIRASEQMLRFMARESRFRRRILGNAFIEFLENAPDNQKATRYIIGTRSTDPFYVFLALPQLDFMNSYEDYRTGRVRLLEACCMVTKLQFPAAQDIIGIATEPGIHNEGRSEDALYFDARNWTVEMEEEARELQQKLELLVNPQILQSTEYEYPQSHSAVHDSRALHHAIPKNPRNKLCPCGSGRKYKHCHGRPS